MIIHGEHCLQRDGADVKKCGNTTNRPALFTSVNRPMQRFWLLALISIQFSLTTSLAARNKDKDKVAYGEGFITNIALSASEVEQVVGDISANGLIRGTKEYNKDEFISGAKAAESSAVFPAWTEGGKVFYKIRTQAIDPRNFKDGGDVGTLVVRYVVMPQGEKNTILRIDALFQEDFRRTVHQSNGEVEISEYKDIREHLDTIELMKRQDEEARAERKEILDKKQGISPVPSSSRTDSSSIPESAVQPSEGPVDTPMRVESPPAQEPATLTPTATEQTPEQRVESLRKQVERIVRSPGAPLKSAPFHTASTLQLLGTGTEVLIMISTPYWYGVETHEGQHGWVMRAEVEAP
jgi:hypothetical protein